MTGVNLDEGAVESTKAEIMAAISKCRAERAAKNVASSSEQAEAKAASLYTTPAREEAAAAKKAKEKAETARVKAAAEADAAAAKANAEADAAAAKKAKERAEAKAKEQAEARVRADAAAAAAAAAKAAHLVLSPCPPEPTEEEMRRKQEEMKRRQEEMDQRAKAMLQKDEETKAKLDDLRERIRADAAAAAAAAEGTAKWEASAVIKLQALQRGNMARHKMAREQAEAAAAAQPAAARAATAKPEEPGVIAWVSSWVDTLLGEGKCDEAIQAGWLGDADELALLNGTFPGATTHVVTISRADGQEFGLYMMQDTGAPFVDEVVVGGAAHVAGGLQEWDCISAVEGRPVFTLQATVKALSAVAKKQPTIRLQVRRLPAHGTLTLGAMQRGKGGGFKLAE
jgi:leucyl-tRNA synthetase